MNALESILVILLAAVLLAAAARRLRVPYPAFLAVGGAVIAFVPGAPAFVLPPDLALALFVAPVLLDAAYDASPRDLRDNWAPLTALVIVAVALTTIAVAWVARALAPAMPWAAAVALGAVVAPPDAAAAIAVLRPLRPPHRILTVLEGESLLNDASALLIYRLAVVAAVEQRFSIAHVAPTFLLAVAGSVLVGPTVGWLFLRLMRRVTDVPTAIILQFVSTFGIWILAERLRLSPVLTMVCYAIAVARRAPEWVPARMRVPSYAVWETAVFLVNVLAFVFIGFQIRPILYGLAPDLRSHYLQVALAVLATVIAVRIAWVMLYNTAVRWKLARYGFHPPRPMTRPTARSGLLVAWSGMRGIVTLAAALALPTSVDGGTFPFRDLIVLTAFSVVLGTLVIQGLTLRPLLRLLSLRDDDPVGREVATARTRTLQAAIASLADESSPEVDAVREEYAARLRSAKDRRGEDLPESAVHDRIRRRALAAARHTLFELRSSDEIGDDAFHQVEEELDWVEMGASAEEQAGRME